MRSRGLFFFFLNDATMRLHWEHAMGPLGLKAKYKYTNSDRGMSSRGWYYKSAGRKKKKRRGREIRHFGGTGQDGGLSEGRGYKTMKCMALYSTQV